MNNKMNTNNIQDAVAELRKMVLDKKKRRNFKADSSQDLMICKSYSEVTSDCTGCEAMPKFSLDSIKKTKASKLSKVQINNQLDEYACLFKYYENNYDGNFVTEDVGWDMDNNAITSRIEKFAQMKILGYDYGSAKSAEKSSYFCAYQEVDGEMVLRPGQIQFFFKHVIKGINEETNELEEFTHYFAFVRWYQFPNPATEVLSAYTGFGRSCWKNRFENMSADCILPVQRLYSGISLKINVVTNVNVAYYLQRKYY